MRMKNWMLILTGIWVCVIFSFSLQPADVSSDTSMGFISKILGVLLPRMMEYVENMSQEQLDVLHFVVRKCAHFTEYMILGILSCSTAMVWDAKKFVRMSILFCVGVACVDETIQLFVGGRAGRIQDVLLDGVGAVVGIVLICIFLSFFVDIFRLNGTIKRYVNQIEVQDS